MATNHSPGPVRWPKSPHKAHCRSRDFFSVEEVESVASGLNLCRTSPQGSSLRAALTTVTVAGLSFAAHTSTTWEPTNNRSPHIIAIIGTGTSIVKLDPEIERVNGTCYGGGTYWGLQRLLTGVDSFEQLEDLIQTGNQNNVENVMLVGTSMEMQLRNWACLPICLRPA